MKVALCGSAPSSLPLVPLSDPSWQIWGCSPGCASYLRTRPDYRIDRWFELHSFDPALNLMPPDYLEWLKGLTCPVYVIEPTPHVPAGVVYPIGEMVEKFSRYFFTSSISYMIALAIHESVEEVALFGIDLSATEEYFHQRPGFHYFYLLARQAGIKVWVPPQSDLLQPHPLYGYSQATPMGVKLTMRAKEIEERMAQKRREHEAAAQEILFLQGARDDLRYFENTWLTSR